MTLNQTPSAERIHIGIFGKRNAGKSSLINALAGQPVSIVSDFKGTTTDPVKKAMELLPLGPVVLTDTPGLDDTGELGTLRIEKTQQILNTTDIALLVIDGQLGITEEDTRILQQIRQKQIPFVIAVNKMDLTIASPVLPDEISGADPVCLLRGNTHPRTKRTACKTARTDTKNPKNRGRSHPSRRLCRAGHSH